MVSEKKRNKNATERLPAQEGTTGSKTNLEQGGIKRQGIYRKENKGGGRREEADL